MNALISRFQALSAREQSMVIGGAGVVICALVYLLILSPFYGAIEARSRSVADKQADLAWMQASLGELQALNASNPQGTGPSDESLVVLIDRTAREANLGANLTGQTPSGESGIRVRLESAPFDGIVEWLGKLQQQHAIDIETATIDRAGTTGLVNASISLVRAGGG